MGVCNAGVAKVGGAYLLPAKYLIDTVGPVCEGAQLDETATLRQCYRSYLETAENRDVGSIAFPCIVTGVYEFPKDLACEVTVDAVREWMSGYDLPREVIFCCFEESDAEMYRDRLAAITA